MKRTRPARRPSQATNTSTNPAGVSRPTRVSGSVRGTVPCATSTVANAMTPCPHMSLYPSLCMKMTPASAAAVTGSVT